MRLSCVSTGLLFAAGILIACCTGTLNTLSEGEGGSDENAGASGSEGDHGGNAGSNVSRRSSSGGSAGHMGNAGAKAGGGAGDDTSSANDTSGGEAGNGGEDNISTDPSDRGGNAKGGSANRGGGSGKGGSTETSKEAGVSRGGNASGSTGGSTGAGGNNGAGTASNTGGKGTGGSGTGGATQCNAPTSGTQGYTTRFWDCCKPSCGWQNNTGGKSPVRSCSQSNGQVGSDQQSACSNGGPAYACWDLSPWAVSDTLAYGYAAFNGGGCGTCYQLQFTGQSNSVAGDPGAAALCGKKMIVQVVNIGNISQGQFDLMIPGGGVGDFDACSRQWNVSNSSLFGERYGGVFLSCEKQSDVYDTRKSCTLDKCKQLFSNSSLSKLLTACNWQIDWLMGADNPKVVYSQVSCPSELTSKSGIN